MKFTLSNKFAIILAWVIVLSGVGLAQLPGKTLLVVAHPDDEYYFAATVYRIAVELHGTVDELIVTNGEGGFRYSTFAEPYYDKALTTESIGRKELPAIRRAETLSAGKILGIRDHYFLDQKDETFTTNSDEGLKHLWDVGFVTNTLVDLIKGQHYQYVFTILPRSTTHGHHQATTILVWRAIRSLPEIQRPVLMGFETEGKDYVSLPGIMEAHDWPSSYTYAFDRTAAVGFHNALNYQIVVNWMIAEHKSQGLLQTMYDKDSKEYVWVDPHSAPSAEVTAASLFRLIRPVLLQSTASK